MKKGLHFIVLITFLVGVLAPACGFSWGNNGNSKFSVVEICTTEGIENRIVEGEQDPNPEHASEQCQFCFAQAKLDYALFGLKTFQSALSIRETDQARHYEVFLLSRLSNDHAARGPPAFI